MQVISINDSDNIEKLLTSLRGGRKSVEIKVRKKEEMLLS